MVYCVTSLLGAYSQHSSLDVEIINIGRLMSILEKSTIRFSPAYFEKEDENFKGGNLNIGDECCHK